MEDGLTNDQWEELAENGGLYLPDLLDNEDVKKLKVCKQSLLDKYPYGFEYGEAYNKNAPQVQKTEPSMHYLQVMLGW